MKRFFTFAMAALLLGPFASIAQSESTKTETKFHVIITDDKGEKIEINSEMPKEERDLVIQKMKEKLKDSKNLDLIQNLNIQIPGHNNIDIDMPNLKTYIYKYDLENLDNLEELKLGEVELEKMNSMIDKYNFATLVDPNTCAKGPNRNDACLGVQIEMNVMQTNDQVNKHIEIIEVNESSAAAEAGLLKGDLLTKLNGKEIGDLDGFVKDIKAFKPGDQVEIAYIRGGKELTVKATLKACENKQIKMFKFSDTDTRKVPNVIMKHKREEVDPCVRLEKLIGKPFLGVYVSYDGTVSEVIPNTSAEANKMQSDDKIVEIAGIEVSSSQEVIDAIATKKPGDLVKVVFMRDGKKQKKNIALGSYAEYNKEEIKRLEERCANKYDATIQPDGAGMGLDTEESAQLKIYPNPNAGRFMFSYRGNAGPATFTLTSPDGKVVYRNEAKDFNGMIEQEIDLQSSKVSGTYYMNVSQEGIELVEKVLVN